NSRTLTINVGGTLTLGSSVLSVGTSGTITLAVGGTLNCGTSIVTGAGAFAMTAGGTTTNLELADAGGISLSGATGNIQVTGTRTYSTTANYTYDGSASSMITGNGLVTCNNLTINNSNGVTQSNGAGTATPVTVTNQLTLTSGNYTVGGASGQINILTLNGPAISPAASASLVTSAFSNLVFGPGVGNTNAGLYIPSSVADLNSLQVNILATNFVST